MKAIINIMIICVNLIILAVLIKTGGRQWAMEWQLH